MVSARFGVSTVGGIVAAGIDAIYDRNTAKWWAAPVVEGGLAPLSIFRSFRALYSPIGPPTFSIGFVYNMQSVSQMQGWGLAANWPLGIISRFPGSFFSGNPALRALEHLAHLTRLGARGTLTAGVSASGPSYFTVSPSFAFSSTASWTFPFVSLNDLGSRAVDAIGAGIDYATAKILPGGFNLKYTGDPLLGFAGQ